MYLAVKNLGVTQWEWLVPDPQSLGPHLGRLKGRK